MLKRIVDFEVAPPVRKDSRGLVALGTSAILHALILLLVIFGLPGTHGETVTPGRTTAAPQPIALPPLAAKDKPLPKDAPPPPPPPTPQTLPPPPPPPPPMQQVELGPDSKKPDAPAKEASAKPADAEAANAAKAKQSDPVPAASDQPKPPEPQPPAAQRIQVPRPGDYTGIGLPRPSNSPFGPPKLDSASGEPPPDVSAAPANSMGKVGLSNRDPKKWENSFDNETAGRCVAIPDLGKNADGSPVLASVIGRILDTDGRSALSGARLQIMGTQFGTFTDRNGEYRLDFDPRLLEKCRVQYVTVVAPGYTMESLKLSIGPKVRSDDVVMRRH